MDDIRLLMLYPELKRTSYWENSKACNNSKTFFGCNNNGSSFCFNGVCIDLKDVDYTNMLYLCTAWQNKNPERITNLKKNYYNYLIYLKKLHNTNKTLLNFDEEMFKLHTEAIATETDSILTTSSKYDDINFIQKNIEKLEFKHNEFNNELTEDYLNTIIHDAAISHEDRLIYEAMLKERQLLSNPNVEIPYT